ncbi:Yip1 member 6 [Geranomyces variabilis]|nr:Yip1 member 6 [Geranomyces variabilis]
MSYGTQATPGTGTGSAARPAPNYSPYDFNPSFDDAPFETPGQSQHQPLGDLSSVTIPVTPMVAGHMGGGASGGGIGGKPALDTLDEPVWHTVKRDLLSIWAKLQQVLYPRKDNKSNILKDWDLWGPLLLCLVLSLRLSLTAEDGQAPAVFTAIFVIVWAGAGAVTLNSKLLGGTVSFFQSVCAIGYCLFPLVIASLVCTFIPLVFVRIIVVGVGFAWAVYASIGFLADLNLDKRRALAVYPIVLFYFVLGWLILISKSLF